MKVMTKEWVKDYDFHDLSIALTPNSHKEMPFVFTNGGTESVAKEHLHTVKTNFNFSENENEMSFVMLPDTFNLDFDYLDDCKHLDGSTRTNDFLYQYVNRLRAISYLPDELLKIVKDKRLLALGYAEEQVRKQLIEYIKDKCNRAYEVKQKCDEASIEAEQGLTIHEQFKEHPFLDCLPLMFDNVEITKFRKAGGEIYLTLEDNVTVVFSGVKILEQEIDFLNTYVYAVELYKEESCYELHLLLTKTDENLVDVYYYATFSFILLKLI